MNSKLERDNLKSQATELEGESWLTNQCDREVYGACNTRGCLRRGGWIPGERVDTNLATCVPHEILQRIIRLSKNQKDIK